MAEWQPRRISADEGAALGLVVPQFEPRRISAAEGAALGLVVPEDRTVWGQLSEIPGGMAVGAVGDIGGSALRGAEAVRFPWRDTYVDLLDRVERADVAGARVQDLLPRFEPQSSPLDAITGPGPRRRAEPASELASLDETIRTQLPSEQAGILRNALRERIRRKGKGQPGGAPDPIAEARAALPPEITERPLYQAGEAVSEAVEQAFPGSPGYHDSLGRTLGRGLGSVAAGVAVGLASGPAAPVTLGALFGAAGAGEAADRAIGEGAGDAAASTAARLGVLAGSTDIVPIEILLRRMPAPARRAVEAVAQRVGGERVAAFAGRVGLQTVVEAVQEGGQQTLQNLIAREVYKPEQELGEGVVPSAALGGGVGAIAALGREGVVALASRRSSSRTGDRARAVMQVPPPSPADEASPIPTTDIQAGREVVADAMAVETANRSLEAGGFTPIGQPVRLNDGTGRTVEGVVTDAETGQDGSVLGVTVSVQDARFGPDPLEIDMTLDELAERGVTLEGMPMPPSAEELAAQDETAAQDRQKAAEEDQREAEKRNRDLERLEAQIEKGDEAALQRYEELTGMPYPRPIGEPAEPPRAYGVDESGTVRSAVSPEGKAVLGALAGGTPTMDAAQLGGALAGMSGTPDGDAMLRALAGAERTPQGDMVMRALAGQGPQMNAEHLGLALSGMAGSPDGAAMMAAMAGGSPTAAVEPGAMAGGTPTADVSAGAMAGRGPEASIPAGAMAGGSPTPELSPAAMAGGGPEASTTPAALAGASPTAAIPPAAMAGGSPTPEIAPAALAGGSPTPEIAPGAMAGDSPTPSVEPAALAGESPRPDGAQVQAALAGLSGTPQGDAMLSALAGTSPTPDTALVRRALAGRAPTPTGESLQAALAGMAATPQGDAMLAALAGTEPTPEGAMVQAALAGGSPAADITPAAMAGGSPTPQVDAAALSGEPAQVGRSRGPGGELVEVQGAPLQRAGGDTPKVRAGRSPDDPDDVVESNFAAGVVSGNETVPVASLTGGVRRDAPEEQTRVTELAEQIRESGRVDRIIVDQDGNVLEGQHRLEAARELGLERIPVTRVVDLESIAPLDAVTKAVRAAQPELHPQHARQIATHALEAVQAEGDVAKVRDEYAPPTPRFTDGWNGALSGIESAQATRDVGDAQLQRDTPAARPTPGAARIRLQRRFTEQEGRVAGDIQRIGKEVFGEGFHVQLAQSIEAPDGAQAHGAYDPANRIAYIALRADEAGMTGSLYHEGLHHLRNAGAFTDAQGADTGPWKTLEREAVNTWRKQYGIEERYGPDTEGMDAAQRERLMNEEAIAEALADYQTRGKETGFGPTVRSALNRLMNFFRRMANGLRGRGFQTWQDVFESDIATGAAGRRTDDQRRTELDRQLMTAWHGSPHRFDKFSTEAIGTGEGAQAFGYGLYFSGKKAVADFYRNALDKPRASSPKLSAEEQQSATVLEALTTIGKAVEAGENFAVARNAQIAKAQKRIEEIEQAIGGANSPRGARLLAATKRTLGAIKKLESAEDVVLERAGATYRVDLAPQEDEYLLWDEPTGGQSDKVETAIQEQWPHYKFNDDMTGADIYHTLASRLGGDQSASEALRAIGVRGIKYLDASSRGSYQDVTHNYVIFDDSDVAIEEVLLQRADDAHLEWGTEGGTTTVRATLSDGSPFEFRRTSWGEIDWSVGGSKTDRPKGSTYASIEPMALVGRILRDLPTTDATPYPYFRGIPGKEKIYRRMARRMGFDAVSLGEGKIDRFASPIHQRMSAAKDARYDEGMSAVAFYRDASETIDPERTLIWEEPVDRQPEAVARVLTDNLPFRDSVKSRARSVYQGISAKQLIEHNKSTEDFLYEQGIEGAQWTDWTDSDDGTVRTVSFAPASRQAADVEIPGAQLQREPSAERDPKDFDDAASKWAGVDLRGAADAVIADKDRMGGFAENVRAQLKGTESVRAPGVEVVDKPTQADLAAWRRFFEPPSSWSKKFPAINALVKSGIQAEIDQSNRIQRLNKDWDRASKKLSRDEFADLTGVMFLGDAEAVTFTDDDLAQMPITDKVRRAYRASRKLIDKIGRFVEQHRRSMALPLLSQRTKLIRQMAGARNMDKSAFRKLYTERANLIAEQRSGTADPETIGARIDALTEKLHGTQPPSEQYAEWAAEADRIQPRIDETKIRHREGYVPHKFFGRWRIFEKVPESDAIVQKGFNDQPFRTEKAARDAAAAAGGGEVVEIEGGYGFKSQWKHVAGEHGFWPSRKDAVRAASKLSRQGAELRVAPVEFTFPEEQATQLSDAAYYRFMGNVEQMVGLEGQDLQDAVRGVARKRFRRRIAGFAQYRKGAQGFSKNLDRVIRTHIGETVRYVSLDKLKFDAINLMEREGLSENRTTVQSRPVLAAAVQQWFKDVNGQKQVLEGQIDQLLNRNWVTPLRGGLAAGAMAYIASGATANPISPVIGAYIGWRVGRGLNQGGPFPTRAITSGMLGDMSHLKLGMTLNVMSALVNTTQITLNTLPVLGTRATSVGFKRFNKAVLSKIRGKPNADWRLMERHDIHPLNTFAEGTRHQFQGEGKLSKISMAFFTSAEGLNRGVTFLGAVSKATGEGKSTGEAHQFAREAMRRTQFHYGAADKPELYRNVLLRVPAQFKNYVSQQIAFAFGLDPKKELPMFLMSLALLTGALGLPLLDLIDDITDQVADFSPIAMMKEEALKALARSELEGGIATFILRGAPGLAGVDMTGRAGMGDKFLPLTLRDWEGPWISTIKNAVRHGAEGASIEDHIRNVTPGFGNPLKVLEAQRNGGVMTSVWKRGRGEYEMTPDEMALKALGARPVREARQQDLRDIERRKIEKRRQDVRRYVDRYVKARQAGDTDEMRHILAEAREQGVPLSRASIQSASRAMLLDRQTRSLKQLPRDMRREGARLREAIDQAAAP